MRDSLKTLSLYLSFYLLVFAIGFLDYVTGPEIGLSLFYFIPIMLMSWIFYKRTVSSFLVPCLSAVVWLLADFYAGHRYSRSWIPYWNMFIRLAMFLITSLTVSRLRKSNASERNLSRTDALTGVFNSRYLAELITKEISRSARFAEPFSFAYIDVDDFKLINDSLGHDQGDQLLRTLTQLIRGNIRDIDVMARLGGDEFGILFPNTDAAQVVTAMNKVYALFRKNISNRWQVTLSAGVLTFRKPPEDWDQVVKMADSLMYRAKRQGKDRAAFEIVEAY